MCIKRKHVLNKTEPCFECCKYSSYKSIWYYAMHVVNIKCKQLNFLTFESHGNDFLSLQWLKIITWTSDRLRPLCLSFWIAYYITESQSQQADCLLAFKCRILLWRQSKRKTILFWIFFLTRRKSKQSNSIFWKIPLLFLHRIQRDQIYYSFVWQDQILSCIEIAYTT